MSITSISKIAIFIDKQDIGQIRKIPFQYTCLTFARNIGSDALTQKIETNKQCTKSNSSEECLVNMLWRYYFYSVLYSM